MYCLISVALSQPLRTAAEKEPKEVWTFNAELRTGICELSTVGGAGYVEAQIPALTPHLSLGLPNSGRRDFDSLLLASALRINIKKQGRNSSPFA